MNKEAMKLALEALEGMYIQGFTQDDSPINNAIIALREALAKPDFWEGYVPEPDKRQQALDKKAENARELGLDYEPVKSGEGASATVTITLPAQDSGIVTAGGFDPRTQRTWVGLTHEEVDDLSREMVKGNKSVNWLSYSIEAKLKEKNGA